MNATDGIIYLSKKGMKELRKSVKQLERDQQKITLELHELDKTSDREDRLIQSEKLYKLEGIESELNEKRLYLDRARVFPRKRDAIMVALGSMVDLIDSTGRMVHYQLVDSLEANPSDGRISIQSPLGQSLVGKKIQQTIEWERGLNAQKLQLVNIR